MFCLLAGTLGAAGCSSSSTGGGGGDDGGGHLTPPAGCNADDTLDCSGGGTGFACDAGSNPEDEDPTYTCSVPTENGSEDDFCCFTGFTGSDSSCNADDGLTTECPDPDSYGFQCADPTDDPTSLDASLTCSAPVDDPDGTSTDFCCVLSGGSSGDDGGGTTACGLDTSVDCTGSGADGYSCPAGDNPEDSDSSLSCSDPTSNGSDDDFCCISFSGGTTCSPDDTVTAGCPDPDSYGYSCDDPTDDPSSLDSSLVCSDGVADADGVHTDFCCTL